MDEIERPCTIKKMDIRQKILIKDKIVQIAEEARNYAALDTGCKSSVMEKSWLKAYMQEAGKEGKEEIVGPLNSNKVFKLGKGGMLRSVGKYLLPMNVAGKSWVIELDIINASILR